VKVPGHKVIRRPGIRAYRVLVLEAHAPATVPGVPATDPIETLLDLAAVGGGSDLERMVARAVRDRLITLDDLTAAAIATSPSAESTSSASPGTNSFMRPIPPWPGSPRSSPCGATGFAAITRADRRA
jgi:hypothetical protein